MRTHSIQVGLPAELSTSGGVLRTAMRKLPVTGPVRLGMRGLAGDGCADRQHHGHEDQAVCVYPLRHLQDLARELAIEGLAPGGLGDNFTIAGGDETTVRLGSRYRIGEALLEVSQPRQPCANLNLVWSCPQLAATLGRSARVGWYLQVREPGIVSAGDAWVLERAAPDGAPTVAEAWRQIRAARA